MARTPELAGRPASGLSHIQAFAKDGELQYIVTQRDGQTLFMNCCPHCLDVVWTMAGGELAWKSDECTRAVIAARGLVMWRGWSFANDSSAGAEFRIATNAERSPHKIPVRRPSDGNWQRALEETLAAYEAAQ